MSSIFDFCRKFPGFAAVYLVVWFALAALMVLLLGWTVGFLVVVLLTGLYGFAIAKWSGCRPSDFLEIGEVEMTIDDWDGAPVAVRTIQKLCLGANTLIMSMLLIFDVLHIAEALWEQNDFAAIELKAPAIHFAFVVVWLGSLYATLFQSGSGWLISEQGIFRFSMIRAWPLLLDKTRGGKARPLMVRVYYWNQVADFYWRERAGRQFLHLHIRNPNVSAPQLESYQLPAGFTDAQRARLSDVFQKHAVSSVPVSGVMSHGLVSQSLAGRP